MRLLIVGTLHGQLTTATKIAMDKGATVTHATDIAQALAVLRSGRVELWLETKLPTEEIRGLWRWVETRLELSAGSLLIDQVMSAANGMLHAAAEIADETTTLAS